MVLPMPTREQLIEDKVITKACMRFIQRAFENAGLRKDPAMVEEFMRSEEIYVTTQIKHVANIPEYYIASLYKGQRYTDV